MLTNFYKNRSKQLALKAYQVKKKMRNMSKDKLTQVQDLMNEDRQVIGIYGKNEHLYN